MATERYLIVGLGNPGRKYQDTRHNVGFRCVDALAQAHNLSYASRKKSKAKIAEGHIAGKQVLIAKPQTFMNLSGSSVQGLIAFYKIPPEHLLVVFDDLDIPLGTLRIRAKGGTGGHKGMTDIIKRLGTQEFPRIRFGIDRPPDGVDPSNFVLRRFDTAETVLVNKTVERVINAIETWLADTIDTAMNHYNGAAEPDTSSTKPPQTLLLTGDTEPVALNNTNG
ncbi:MAG: aminoacyl-tRNA hydrolase [Anaerolineae bacterium]|nr:aminoacyl-tRNA hydrolase [Anaerolineae bacterium]